MENAKNTSSAKVESAAFAEFYEIDSDEYIITEAGGGNFSFCSFNVQWNIEDGIYDIDSYFSVSEIEKAATKLYRTEEEKPESITWNQFDSEKFFFTKEELEKAISEGNGKEFVSAKTAGIPSLSIDDISLSWN